MVANLWATGITTASSLTELARPGLDEMGITPSAQLGGLAHGSRVIVAERIEALELAIITRVRDFC
ncbi:MAG: hypothetical protein ACYCS7_10230 [Acidimicrobiales bacterium]